MTNIEGIKSYPVPENFILSDPNRWAWKQQRLKALLKAQEELKNQPSVDEILMEYAKDEIKAATDYDQIKARYERAKENHDDAVASFSYAMSQGPLCTKGEWNEGRDRPNSFIWCPVKSKMVQYKGCYVASNGKCNCCPVYALQRSIKSLLQFISASVG
jgi:hypothetical protein